MVIANTITFKVRITLQDEQGSVDIVAACEFKYGIGQVYYRADIFSIACYHERHRLVC